MSTEKLRALTQARQASAVYRLRNEVAQLSAPSYPPAFLIEHLTTDIEWADLVLHPDTLRQVQAMARQLAPDAAATSLGTSPAGYQVLLCGPAGTGKTLTAAVLGKYLGNDVVRVDISQAIAKYSSETEKSLGRLFERAAAKNWVLFIR
ncbi:AAA family ATPase [Hymenobacter sp. BT186]|uniref:AAA family ATPase n=1 Tax=Hymenobacter telluris TaxID=2816474 RepID=A0A939EZG0_9BACT|nr:AAA family ATPase [Hymenobacter telluris]MBO0360019.1 AAA family ATPase [Hymenobacter telluris]MBW3376046.1 ATP-binding protein [Hymenobacter norwichensis]